MPKSAVPIFRGRSLTSIVKRPTWLAISKAALPRDLNQLPSLCLGVSMALLVAGLLFRQARLPGSINLFLASFAVFAAVMTFHAVVHLLVRLKLVDKSRADAIALPKLVSETPAPPPEPTVETKLDTAYVPSARFDGPVDDHDEQLEAAIRNNVARAVVQRTGATIAFAKPIPCDVSGTDRR